MTGRAARAGRAACALAALVVLVAGGCTRGSTSSRPPIHTNPNMDSQPKVRAFDASPWFADGMAMRPPVEGTVARGELNADPVYVTGASADGTFAAAIPLAVDAAVLARGAERFAIYCEPCHGGKGNGKGRWRCAAASPPPTWWRTRGCSPCRRGRSTTRCGPESA